MYKKIVRGDVAKGLASRVGVAFIVFEMGQGESKKKEKEDSLKQLTEKGLESEVIRSDLLLMPFTGVEAWTVADVKEWIRLQECGPELQKLTEEFQIDGDGILMVEFEELIQLKKNGGKWKLPKQESLQR